MPRGGGSIQPRGIYHLISRFVAKEWFVESATERRAYLSLLGPALARTDWRCFCFAVMSSHIHLGVVTGDVRLADWMRPMHATFAQWLNERRDRIGGVFVRGPTVKLVEREAAGRLIDYVHLNPVRAGVVASPDACDWTSYRAYAGTAARPGWLDVDCGLELASVAGAGTRDTSCTDRRRAEELGLLPHARRGRPRRQRTPPEKSKPA